MAQAHTALKICPREAERVWDWEGFPVLRAALSLPAPEEGAAGPAVRRLERFYRAQGQAFLRRCETVLLPQALSAARTALASSHPVPCLEAALTHRITLSAPGILSLHTDLREVGGSPSPQLRRWGDTWDLSSGFLLPLSAWYPPGTAWKKAVRKAVLQAAEGRPATGAVTEPLQRTLRRSFDPRRYYLTPEGLVLFWPQYAPVPDGLFSLLLPYASEGPLAPQV